ncbi:MAG: alpha/beta fold hydrolase, partial [Tetrasphaera sp.]|nr:alpha/beta fold hydrolase [Tetrasphaera sp.]
MTEVVTRTVEVPGAVLTYDVRRPETESAHLPLFVFGSPMAASGFEALVAHFTDRTVITYDPRGAERSSLADDGAVTGELHGEDLHRVVEAVGLGQVDAFGSSGGAAFALHWMAQYPGDVRTLVAHEPPLTTLLEDREMATRVNEDIVATYQREGYGPALAKFIQLVMHTGPLPDDYLDRPPPDPAMFGLPAEQRSGSLRCHAPRPPRRGLTRRGLTGRGHPAPRGPPRGVRTPLWGEEPGPSD